MQMLKLIIPWTLPQVTITILSVERHWRYHVRYLYNNITSIAMRGHHAIFHYNIIFSTKNAITLLFIYTIIHVTIILDIHMPHILLSLYLRLYIEASSNHQSNAIWFSLSYFQLILILRSSPYVTNGKKPLNVQTSFLVIVTQNCHSQTFFMILLNGISLAISWTSLQQRVAINIFLFVQWRKEIEKDLVFFKGVALVMAYLQHLKNHWSPCIFFFSLFASCAFPCHHLLHVANVRWTLTQMLLLSYQCFQFHQLLRHSLAILWCIKQPSPHLHALFA